MIGFVTTQEQAQAVNDAVAQAQIDRGFPVFWLPGLIPIFSGEHAGKTFIPCGDETLSTPLIGHPPLTPQDFPEFGTIVEAIGGLNARITIHSNDITPPEHEQ